MLLKRLKKNKQPIVKLNPVQINALTTFQEKVKNNIYHFEEVSCLCGSNNYLTIGEVDRYAIPVRTKLCRNCGMMWTSPRMKEESLTQFYNQDYRSIYVGNPSTSDVFFEEQIRHGNEIYQFITPEFANKNNLTAYEIGCGSGGILIPFQNQGWSVYGCDLGSEYLKKGIESGLTLEYGSENSLKKYGKADLVILSHVLEHFSNPLKTLESIDTLLTNGGYIYIELPGIFSIQESYGDILLFLQNAHLYHFTLKTLDSLMSRVGFKRIKGNEHIQALYQKQSDVNVNSQDQFLKILFYLHLIELKQTFSLTDATITFKNMFVNKIINNLKKIKFNR